MNIDNYKFKILDTIDINLELKYFGNQIYRFDENTLYENDESDIFIFFNWNILINKDYNENTSLINFISINGLKNISKKRMFQVTNSFYSSRLDRKLVNKLINEKILVIRNEEEILESIEKIYLNS